MTERRSNNEFDSLESFFHGKLRDASFANEEGPWKQIEAELERMEKEKRKRRFFWFFFSGIALLGGLAALWFFVLDEKIQDKETTKNSHAIVSSDTKQTHVASKQNSLSANTNSNSQNVPSQNTQADQTAMEAKKQSEEDLTTNSIAKSSSVNNFTAPNSRIQLAACRNKANPAIFKNLPFVVTEVEGKDGFTRYFAETEVNDEALQTVRSAGFAGAFVKKDLDPSTQGTIVKEASSQESNTTLYAASVSNQNKNEPAHPQTVSRDKKTNENSSSSVENKPSGVQNVASTNIVQNADNTSSKEEPAPNSNATNVNPASVNSISNATKTENPSNVTSENSNAVNSESRTGITDTLQNTVATQTTKTDTASPVAIAETRQDSVPRKEEPKDSSKTTTADVNPAPFSPEWAIMLLAGPNIFTSQAQSHLFPTSGESQPISLNTELKLQFRPIKLLSFSGGVNYTTYSAKQDRTSFRFNKLQTSDYIFYSAFGPMAAPMSTMLDGYSMLAPFDTFNCAYSQNSKLNMLNVPIEVNLHVLNKSRINVFMGVGANNSFALSQQSTLTLHKEHFDNNISYNKVTVSPFSLSLIFSLGCDVRIGKKLYLSFVPSYRYGVTNLSTTSGTTFSPAYFSGNAGLKFRF
jgi:hypothetical protein